MRMISYIKLCLLVTLTGHCYCSYERRTHQYTRLLNMYKHENTSMVDVIPIKPMNVTVDMVLYALNDYDEVAGNIELVAALKMSWTDFVAAADKHEFIYNRTGTSFLVPHNKIWTPKLVLSNAVDDVSAVGDLSYMCRFHMDTYRVQWMPRVLIKGACSPDVTYYPFDRQSCVFTYIPWGYYSDEVLLLHREGDWDLGSYEENGEWTLIETKTETFISSSTSKLKLSLTIERKPLYFAFNIILPILVLCCLNSMVFWLPAASGERVGFSVTCFLSFVVLLNLVFDILPRSSSPISYLCYYLVVMMAFSGLTTGIVIIEMNVFHNTEDSKVPEWLQVLIKIITFRCRSICRQNDVSDTSTKTSSVNLAEDSTRSTSSNGNNAFSGSEHEKGLIIVKSKLKKVNKINSKGDLAMVLSKKQDNRKELQHSATDGSTKEREITWLMVGHLLDKFFFCAFLGGEIFFSITFLLPLYFRAKSS